MIMRSMNVNLLHVRLGFKLLARNFVNSKLEIKRELTDLELLWCHRQGNQRRRF